MWMFYHLKKVLFFSSRATLFLLGFHPNSLIATSSLVWLLNWSHYSVVLWSVWDINLLSRSAWNLFWHWAWSSLAMLKARWTSFGCLCCCGTMYKRRAFLINLWSVQDSVPMLIWCRVHLKCCAFRQWQSLSVATVLYLSAWTGCWWPSGCTQHTLKRKQILLFFC